MILCQLIANLRCMSWERRPCWKPAEKGNAQCGGACVAVPAQMPRAVIIYCTPRWTSQTHLNNGVRSRRTSKVISWGENTGATVLEWRTFPTELWTTPGSYFNDYNLFHSFLKVCFVSRSRHPSSQLSGSSPSSLPTFHERIEVVSVALSSSEFSSLLLYSSMCKRRTPCSDRLPHRAECLAACGIASE